MCHQRPRDYCCLRTAFLLGWHLPQDSEPQLTVYLLSPGRFGSSVSLHCLGGAIVSVCHFPEMMSNGKSLEGTAEPKYLVNFKNECDLTET